MSTSRLPISVQINLAPSDATVSASLLRKQIIKLYPYIHEIVLTLDTHRGKGRFAEGWLAGRERIQRILSDAILEFPSVRVQEVDYSEKGLELVRKYFKYPPRPTRDYRGGPHYVYFYGLASCRNDLVFHLDGDIILGGQALSWLRMAIRALKNPAILAVSTLPGPPSEDGALKQEVEMEDRRKLRYCFNGLSTQVFMLSRARLSKVAFNSWAPMRFFPKACMRGQSWYELPEVVVSSYMKRYGLKRMDFGGHGRFFTLHIPYKSQRLFAALPEIIERVERSLIPAEQSGFYDLHDSLFDFAEERAALARRGLRYKLSHIIRKPDA